MKPTNNTKKFAAFELNRIGYNMLTKVASPSTEDADDLLDAVLGEDIDPETEAGVIWAIRNRPVDWDHQFAFAKVIPSRMAHLDQLLVKAGMTHVKTSAA